MEYPSGLILLLAVIVIGFLIHLSRPSDKSDKGEHRPVGWQLETKRAKEAAAERKTASPKRRAFLAKPLKRILAIASAAGALIRLPIVQYNKHRLETKKRKQVAAEREAERRQKEIEEERRSAEERRRSEIEKAEQIAAERQRREAVSAKRVAVKVQRRKQKSFWESLNGVEFERELGRLFRTMGYRVASTPRSGDQGVDLVLRQNRTTTIVQCKAHKRPAGPAVVRELFGSMVHYRADGAILACTGGFTDGVIDFVRGKPIKLLSSWDIARLAEAIDVKPPDITGSPPLCPVPRCGETMKLRELKNGAFWGCPRYPTCRGTRDL